MKKTLILLVAVLLTATAWAQTPQSFKYQAVARDASGDVVADQAVGMQISILQGSTNGTAVYVETFTPTTNEFGLINLNIGAGTVVSGDFTTIDWSSDTYFIKVEMDITGGMTYEEYGTSQLLSVPYALHAKTAANTFSGNYSDLTGTPNNVSTFTNDAGYLTSFTETDPVFGAHAANGIGSTNITNRTTAYGWGDHSLAGYLTSFTETDPVFGAHAANGITSTNITNWTTAYGWGDHSLTGYLTSYTETDPVFVAHAANGITSTNITNWTTAFSWGDHSAAGYLTSYNETDPVTGAVSGIIKADGTGNISAAIVGTDYLNSEVDGSVINEIQDLQLVGNILTITNIGVATEINLSSYLDNTDTQLNETDVDAMVANNGYLTEELQNLEAVLTKGNSAGDQQISDLLNPIDDYDAVTKVYVDDLVTENSPITYEVSDVAQGGVVFWVDETEQHGLVLYMSEVSASAEWCSIADYDTWARNEGILGGQMNTTILVANSVSKNCEHEPAYNCSLLKAGLDGMTRFGDWYLPSKDEMRTLKDVHSIVNDSITFYAGDVLIDKYYWSSTESGTTYAVRVNLVQGAFGPNTKADLHAVRAIRRF